MTTRTIAATLEDAITRRAVVVDLRVTTYGTTTRLAWREFALVVDTAEIATTTQQKDAQSNP